MTLSWYDESKKFKSPLRVVAAVLLRSRETQLAKNRRLREERKQFDEQRERDAQQAKLKYDKSKAFAKRLIDFVHDAEQQLREGERLPLSTEIPESSFGLYKQLERQHSKSGFTSLLACFPAMLHSTTPESVTEAFGRVSSADVKIWIAKHFPSTVTSHREVAGVGVPRCVLVAAR